MRHHTYRRSLWTLAAAGALIVGCQRSGDTDYRATADRPSDRMAEGDRTSSDAGVRMSAERTTGDRTREGGIAVEDTGAVRSDTTVRPAPDATTPPPAPAPAPAPEPAAPAPAPDAAPPADPTAPPTPSPTSPDRDRIVPPETGADRPGDPARNATPPAPIDLDPAPATRPSAPIPTTRPASELNK